MRLPSSGIDSVAIKIGVRKPIVAVLVSGTHSRLAAKNRSALSRYNVCVNRSNGCPACRMCNLDRGRKTFVTNKARIMHCV